MFARARTSLLSLARTSVIVAARIMIAIAQTTVVIAAGWLTLLRYKSLGIHGFAMLGLDTVEILCSQCRYFQQYYPFSFVE
jgi:hypothetical protein